MLGGQITTMRELIDTRRQASGQKPPKRALPTPLMKAMTPLGPVVGKLMNQGPNLRELINSADNVTFWAKHDKASASSNPPLAGSTGPSRHARDRGQASGTAAGRPEPRTASPLRLIDVKHLGGPRVIGCWELDGILIDPGPASSLQGVIDALEGGEPRAAPADPHPPRPRRGERDPGGALARLPVHVHERGAAHLADPSELLASAGRLYGEGMGRLWGKVLPVPEANVLTAAGAASGCSGVEVASRPGTRPTTSATSATPTGRAFVGDVAAVRIPPPARGLPPTPPPRSISSSGRGSIERSSGPGRRRPRDHPLRGRRRPRGPHAPRWAGACASRPSARGTWTPRRPSSA